MASIVKKQGKTGVSYQVIIRKGRFREKPLTRTFSLKKDAEVWGREQERLIDMKRHQDPRLAEMVTLDQALTKYFKTIETPGTYFNEPTTIDRKRACGTALKEYLGSNITLAEVTPRLMSEYRDHRLNIDKVSASTVRQELSLISHMFTIAVHEWELLVNNPIEKIARPKPAEGRVIALTDQQARIIINESKKARMGLFPAYLLVLMHTGMRASEAAGLRRQDVDLDRQTITIKKTKSKTPRTVPLTEAVALALSGLKAKDYFFLTESELTKPHLQKRPAQKFRESWEAAKGRAILSDPSIPKEITLHDIRHSAATHLIESEVPLRTVADILGHKTIQMTMRYTHPSMKHKAEMMQRIEGFGMDPQIEISEERILLIHQLTEALLLAKSQCADEDLVKALEGIAAYSQRVSLS